MFPQTTNSMVDNLFVIIVTIIAIIYSIVVRKLQYVYGNRKEMEAFQAESKRIQGEYNQSVKEKNAGRTERLMEEQKQLLGKMGGLMFGQIKVMLIVIVVFLGVLWFVNFIDPHTKDDIKLSLLDNGIDCDKIAGDNVFSGCYEFKNSNYGYWTVTASAYGSNGELIAQNGTYFAYKEPSKVHGFYEKKGKHIGIELDSKTYYPSQTATITAELSEIPTKVEATLDSGSFFYAELPFTIPIFNVKIINRTYWWFILMSVIMSLIIVPVYTKLEKKFRGASNDKEKRQIKINKEEKN